MTTTIRTKHAIELDACLRRAAELIQEIDTGTTDEQSAELYRLLCAVTDGANAILETPCLRTLYDVQAVMNSRPNEGFAG